MAGVGLLALLLLVVAGLRTWREHDQTQLERAIGFAPRDAVRFSWTDWAGVRADLGVDFEPLGQPSESEMLDLLGRAFDADLSSASAMVQSAPVLRERFDFSPATVRTELLAQSTAGSVLVLRMSDALDLDSLRETLADLGYSRPDSADGLWVGGDDLVARIADGGVLSPQFNHFAIDDADHLVLTSDTTTYLREAIEEPGSDVDEADGDEADTGLRLVAGTVGDPLSAEVYSGDYACGALAMSQADEDDRTAADQLLAAAGRLDPLAGFAMAVRSDLDIEVAMSFETDDQARRNATSRARLAAGAAPGQGGDFGERFRLGPVSSEGSVVTMMLEPREGADVLSDLSSGPLLFASC